MKPLTKRQRVVLKEIALAWQGGGFPIVNELARRMGLAGESSLTPTLYRMEDSGLVQIKRGVRGKPRIITLTASGKAALAEHSEVDSEVGCPQCRDLLATCEMLVAYRDRAGALNFQLEKADTFIDEMRAILEGAVIKPEGGAA